MKKNITSITLGKSLPLFLLFILAILTVISFNFRTLIMLSMEERILSIAEVTQAGLTAHMKGGLMQERSYFIREIAHAPHIKQMKIIRSDAVCDQFGTRLFTNEKRTDPFLANVLASKKPYYEMSEWGEKATLRAIVPYVASSKGNLNCLQCHKVPENTVLGAVDIELDVTDFRNQAWLYLVILFGVISVFTLFIILQTSRVIEKFVRKPLLEIIDLAKSVFFQTQTEKPAQYESEEFQEVASHFIQFGEELKEREARIEQTSMKFQSLNDEIDTTLKETLFAMGEAEEKRSKETSHHTRRVVEYSRLLATLLEMDEHELDLLVTASPLHDIGKIGIPDSILLKPGKLTDDERSIMKTHTSIGYEILKHSEREVILSAAIIAHEHHERWDGLGYPRGLKGDEIHLFGRIVGIADVFDALSTKRVYKDAWPMDKIKDYFAEERGKSFDPLLVDLFLKNFHIFQELQSKHYDVL